ncbi:hypothetical protein N0V82_004735 [Gnomoniopsis sp. IMI 355080]|nr:hypothetical protein N0V82_004735 [Gnomoniopsis sp. IMI 355080]
MASIKTVGVISTGVIGSSFIALFLSHGLRVLVCSPSGSPTAESKLASYLERIWPTFPPQNLSPTASLANYQFVGTSFEGYYDQLDFVQENIPERLDLKRALLASLDARLRPEVIIASSTSGIVPSALITDCGDGTTTHGGGGGHPERILVGHPYNPPHLIPLVEVVPHAGSDAGVCERALAFYRSVGRKPVLVKKEVPGFVANRLQAVVLREAFALVLDGVVTAEELGVRWPFIGPFMTNVLGGGGGRDGFRHLVSHIATTAQVWFDDIDAKRIVIRGDGDMMDKLDASVQEMLKGRDTTDVQKQLAMSLVGLLQLKNEARESGPDR